METTARARRLRFGAFDVDLRSGELHKRGIRLKLQDQPFQVLALLLEHPGEVVTREELRQKLWPADTFVDFDTGLNSAIKKLRDVLGDSAEKPRYVETLPRRGYRFICPLSGQAEQATPAPPAVAAGPARRGRVWLAVAALALLAIVAVGVWQSWRPRIAFAERDWALIAAFENRTGEEVFDGTLEHALEYELAGSSFVNVVSRLRVDDALRLMKKPMDTPITPEVAREVALRDGGIRAVISGRITKLDGTYALSVAVLNPGDGAVVVGFREEASGHSQVFPAMRRLASRVRGSLGERLADIRLSEQKLEKVTTPSLRALRSFSEGTLLSERGEHAAAERFLREALKEDPDFASAHLWLAYAVMGQLRPREEYLGHARRAVELSPGVTEEERDFIQAAFHLMNGENKKAVPLLEVLLRRRPDHYFGTSNLIIAYRRLGRHADADDLVARSAELRPNDFVANARAAHSLLAAGHAERSLPFAERARFLMTPENQVNYFFLATTLYTDPVKLHIANGKMSEALAALRSVPSFPGGTQPRKDAHYIGLFHCNLTLGRLREAESFASQIHDPPIRQFFLALASYYRGDLVAARERAKENDLTGRFSTYSTLDVELFVRIGLLDRAREAFSVMKEREEDYEGEFTYARALLDWGEGRLGEAIRGFETYSTMREKLPVTRDHLPSNVLAEVLEANGDLEGALRVLQPIPEVKRTALLTQPGFIWIQGAWQRAKLLRRLGRTKEAAAMEAELGRHLAFADADHIILVQLKKQSTAENAR